MGGKYLIDTNVIIYFAGNLLPPKGRKFVAEILDSEPNISVITKIELLGSDKSNDAIRSLIENAQIHGLDDEIVEKTISLRRTYKTKLPDAIIAATATVYNLTLITADKKDFQMRNVEVINPLVL